MSGGKEGTVHARMHQTWPRQIAGLLGILYSMTPQDYYGLSMEVTDGISGPPRHAQSRLPGTGGAECTGTHIA